MTSVMKVITRMAISLLTTDRKTRKFIAATREIMEESLKALHIEASVLARMSNAMCDILLSTEEVVLALVGNVLTIKSVRLQTE